MTKVVESRFQHPEDSPGFLLWQLTMLWQRKIKKELDKIGITHTQFVLMASLGWLQNHRDEVTQTDVAAQSNTDRMMVSKVLRSLEEKGLVERKDNKVDTRAKNISLTRKGQDMVRKAMKAVEDADELFFSVLKPDHREFSKGMLQLILKNS